MFCSGRFWFKYYSSIPLLEDEAGNVNDIVNCRAIAFIQMISKFFEVVLLLWGFSCNWSISVWLQTKYRKCRCLIRSKYTINNCIANSSSVFVASLDLSKAFDCVNHVKWYNSMLSTGIPVDIVNVICNCYSKLLVSVRWNNIVSLPVLA